MKCQVIGDPPPVITWYHDGVELKPNKEIQSSFDMATGNCSLVLTKVFPDDFGEYLCEAQNGNGVDITSANLICIG